MFLKSNFAKVYDKVYWHCLRWPSMYNLWGDLNSFVELYPRPLILLATPEKSLKLRKK